MSYTYFAYRLPHESDIHFLKGTITKRSSIVDVLGRGIVISDFRSENIYQIENIEPCSEKEFEFYFKDPHDKTLTFENYEIGFNKLLAELKSGRFDKVVYSKTKVVDTKIDIIETYKSICKAYLNTFNYILSSEETGVWMGASPELLCEIEDNNIKAVSLAGTKKAEEKWTNKEIQEQLYVTRYIEDKFREMHCRNINIEGPKNISAGPIEHLKSEISAEMMSRESWRKMIESLHPTPAICGIPTKKSMELIQEVEAYKRFLYTGYIGVFTDEFKKCFVNLRCMQLHKNQATLYVGGGMTKDSDINREWDETERKASTLERFIS
ncbi:chorismate-binding protein [Paracrocinitomix mangrovi]|uniref:chorismate-binding protein n=1 Tax=Paracrocinitomix mangrovi TaxID=2862509 RepID=UPI001C8ED1D9|nr:chorismate-binding protein [Paracrocinitomix mangrovi]UKN01386.1 chorismate-binding protein [Paracrocinitomix mangrovi]